MTTRVTITDVETGDTETCEITDDYVLIREGSAQLASTQIHRRKDGTITHVLTVKGCKR